MIEPTVHPTDRCCSGSSVVSVNSRYHPPPTRLQRWVVARRRPIRIVCVVYVLIVLAFLALAVAHGEAEPGVWFTSILSTLSGLALPTLLLGSVQRYVERWDASHPVDQG